MKIFNNIKTIYAGLALLLATTLTTSCQTGLEYEDVPEEYYSNVDLQGCTLSSRYLFEGCIWAKNYVGIYDNPYVTWIAETSLNAQEAKWINNTGAAYNVKVKGETVTVANGEEVSIPCGLNNMYTRDDSSAPEGKVYVLTFYLPNSVSYATSGKSFLFDLNKYTGTDHFELVNPTDGKAEQVKTAMDLTHLVVSLVPGQNTGNATLVKPQDDAPKLGTPGDYTQPRKYLVVNNMRRPSGVPQAKRMYEVQFVVLP